MNYITAVKFPPGTGANKVVDGKTAHITGPTLAYTLDLRDVDSFGRLLESVTEQTNVFLIAGYVPGAVPTKGTHQKEFYFATKDQIGKPSGWAEVQGKRCIAKTKINMRPSNWVMFDRDITDDMPPELADLSVDEWIEKMDELIPGFDQAGKVIVSSNSARIVNNGQVSKPGSFHCWLQVKDPNDSNRAAKVALSRAMLTGVGYMRKWGDKEHRRWTIYDNTVFSPERPAYDGKPIAPEVLPAKIRIIEGGKIDTLAAVSDLTITEEKELVSQFGATVQRSSAAGQGVSEYIHLYKGKIKLDTKVELADGRFLSVRDFWLSDEIHVRCQVPPELRYSRSLNAFLGKFQNGTPFIFDNGDRAQYILTDEQIEASRAHVVIEKLKGLEDDRIRLRWTDELKDASALVRHEVKDWVKNRLGVTATPVNQALKDMEKRWTAQTARFRVAQWQADCRSRGLLPVVYDESKIDEHVTECTQALYATEEHFAYAGKLARVIMDTPTSVRQVRQYKEGTYPEMPVIRLHNRPSLGLYLQSACRFILAHNDKLVEAPRSLVSKMLAVSGSEAPNMRPLVGVMENPAVRRDASVVSGKGYDRDTGFYLMGAKPVELPNKITQSMAEESYRWLRDIALADFPFMSPLHAAAAVSALLSAVQRRLIEDTCPYYVCSSPVQSSGKTTFFHVLFSLAWGREAAVQTYSEDGVEMRKVLLSVFLEGQAGVLFDNVEAGTLIRSSVLASVGTSGYFKDRILGRSEIVGVPTNTLICFTGNNIAAAGDLAWRTLVFYIDPRTTRPDKRKFTRGDLFKWCEDNRDTFFYHALRVIVGGMVSGYRGQTPSRFKDWDKMVRFPLLWASGLDVYELIDEGLAEDDLQRGEFGSVAGAWYEQYGGNFKTVGEVAADFEMDFASVLGKFVSGSPTGVGRILSGIRNLILEHEGVGYRFVSMVDKAKNQKKWAVEKI